MYTRTVSSLGRDSLTRWGENCVRVHISNLEMKCIAKCLVIFETSSGKLTSKLNLVGEISFVPTNLFQISFPRDWIMVYVLVLDESNKVYIWWVLSYMQYCIIMPAGCHLLQLLRFNLSFSSGRVPLIFVLRCSNHTYPSLLYWHHRPASVNRGLIFDSMKAHCWLLWLGSLLQLTRCWFKKT